MIASGKRLASGGHLLVLDRFEGELVSGQSDADRGRFTALADELLRQRVADVAVDDAADLARAVLGSVGELDEMVVDLRCQLEA